jgi:hypothetical protein
MAFPGTTEAFTLRSVPILSCGFYGSTYEKKDSKSSIRLVARP